MKYNKINIPWSNPRLGKEEIKHIKESFKSQRFTLGSKVKKFEEKLSKYLNVKYAIAVNNGTIALDLALKTIGIKPGDEVILPAITYFSNASSISYQNAIPVFVDVNLNDYGIEVSQLEKAWSPNMKAIMMAHTLGNPFNLEAVVEFAKKSYEECIQVENNFLYKENILLLKSTDKMMNLCIDTQDWNQALKYAKKLLSIYSRILATVTLF